MEATEELNSELTGLNKGDKEKKKRIMIIGLILSAIFIIILLTIIIVIMTGSKNSDDDDSSNMEVIGEINCIYNIQTENENTIILGNEFQKSSNFDIYIDGTKIKYTKEYQFNSMGDHNVQIKLYNNINMDYMFKDVQGLISVEMESDKNCEIISMISTFENCYDFNKFEINGFDVNKLKSMKKLFYKSSLITYSFNSFNTQSLEDISYMFAVTDIEEFSIKNLFKILTK